MPDHDQVLGSPDAPYCVRAYGYARARHEIVRTEDNRTIALGLTRKAATRIENELNRLAMEADELATQLRTPWKCEAKIWSGPGHQSGVPCSNHTPHALDGDHYVSEIVYEWTGHQAFS
jgi:hypothetical protein